MVVDPPPPGRHPLTAILVVEVAVTTQEHDAWKAHRYAGAGVDEYWIVDLPGRAVTVHRGATAAGYAVIERRVDGERIATAVGADDVDVTSVLGPPQPTP